MRTKRFKSLCVMVLFISGIVLPVQAMGKSVAPMVCLLLSSGIPGQVGGGKPDKTPTLSQMVTQDSDKIELSWVPGSDGVTPESEIEYKVYLSTDPDFIPGPETLKKTVTGVTQTEIGGLEPDTLYYAKVVAVYPSSKSEPSGSLQAKTSAHGVELDDTVILAKAEDLGLGTHTTTDGSTYVFAGGTPPADDSLLISKDATGHVTLRKVVDSSTAADGTVTVHTIQGSLTDVLDKGMIYSSFQLTKASSQVVSRNAASFKHVNADEPFTATVTSEFEPQVITTFDWGESSAKTLDSAEIGVIGTISFDARGQYDFTEAGTAEKNFSLFRRSWISEYSVGSVTVYQELILTMDVVASASAEKAVKALSQATLSETVEFGARYNGSSWVPYITHNESSPVLTASMDIAGAATGSIRLIPKIEVKFYEVQGAGLSVEPFTQMTTTLGTTTDNTGFLSAHPALQSELTSFEKKLGLESKVGVDLESLSRDWDVLPETCILGESSCTEQFVPITLFSLPGLQLRTTSTTNTRTDLVFEVTDGASNLFTQGSITWEVFPADDASIVPGACTKTGNTTSCNAVFNPGVEEEYTVFASGYGRIGETARRFKSMDLSGVTAIGGQAGPEPVAPGGTVVTPPVSTGGASLMWQRSDNGKGYTWEEAGAYCQNLVQDGYSDWRLPAMDELKTIVACSNGTPIPLKTYPYHPYECGDGQSSYFARPAISSSFATQSGSYWTATAYDSGFAWAVYFSTGLTGYYNNTGYSYVRCVR